MDIHVFAFHTASYLDEVVFELIENRLKDATNTTQNEIQATLHEIFAIRDKYPILVVDNDFVPPDDDCFFYCRSGDSNIRYHGQNGDPLFICFNSFMEFANKITMERHHCSVLSPADLQVIYDSICERIAIEYNLDETVEWYYKETVDLVFLNQI